ncbi:MAG: MFS transporter, partial [Gammaproteobacteria bacterium]|nr:MFS transporter [Gammaproteobacteria bacterium]
RFSASAGLLGEETAFRLLYFLFYGSGAAWMPFFNVYLEQVGLSGLQIGTLAGIRPVVQLLGQPLWGVFADLWGRRRTLLLTLLLTTFVLIGFGWKATFWFFFGWLVLQALLSSPLGPLVDSLALDHVEERHNLSYGQFRIWGSIGWTVIAYAVGHAIAGHDLRLTFVYAAIFSFLAWCMVLRTPRNLGSNLSDGARWKDVSLVLRNRKLLIFLAMITLLGIGSAPLFTFYPVYLAGLGASRQLIGLAASLLGLSELPIFYLAAAIVKRIGHIKAIGITFLFFSARAFLYSFISQPALATAVQVLHAPFSLFLLASVDYVNQQVPSAWRATGQSLFWAAHMGAAGFLGNILAGFLYDRMGVQDMFRLSGFLILAVALVTMVALREKPVHSDG